MSFIEYWKCKFTCDSGLECAACSAPGWFVSIMLIVALILLGFVIWHSMRYPEVESED